MALTKSDFKDWLVNPVTKLIIEGLNDELLELQSECTLRNTCDETVMATARNQGELDGILRIKDVYATLEGNAPNE